MTIPIRPHSRIRVVLNACFLMAIALLQVSDAVAGGWQRVGADYLDVAAEGNVVIVVGTVGTLLVSRDGGISWRQPQTATDERLRAVGFVNASTPVAVGDSGLVMRSTDAGASWTSTRLQEASALTSLAFIDDRGWSFDDEGRLFATTDAGVTWSRIGDRLTWPVHEWTMASASRFAAVSDSGRIFLSTDGGVGWDVVHQGDEYLYAIDFSDSMNGFAGGLNGDLLRTSDGGATWSPVTDLIDAIEILEIDARPDGRVILAGGFGRSTERTAVARSADAGTTWSNVRIPPPIFSTVQLYSIAHGPSFTVAVGNLGTILRSTDDGETWTAVASSTFHDALGSRAPLVSLATTGGDTAVVANGIASGGGWSRTTDGGITWNLGIRQLTDRFLELHFVDDSTGVVMTGNRPMMFATTDAGRTWSSWPSTVTPGAFQTWSMEMVDDDTGFMCADAIAYRTVDRGRTWTGTEIDWASSLFDVSALTPTIAHVIALNSEEPSTGLGLYRLYRTDDGGISWRMLLDRSNVHATLSDVAFLDSLRGFVTVSEPGSSPENRNGYLLRTTDAGATWDSVPDLGAAPNAIRFFNERHGFMLGTGLTIWETTDGGDSWTRETLPGATLIDGLLDIELIQDRRTLIVSGFGVMARKELAESIPAGVVDDPVRGRVASTERGNITAVPNPSTGSDLALELRGPSGSTPQQVNIFDIAGTSVMSATVDVAWHNGVGRCSLDTDGLGGGTYLIVFNDGLCTWSGTVVLR